MMESITGLVLKDIPASSPLAPPFRLPRQKLGDLLYYEGPILSLYADDNDPDAYYLCRWTDCDQDCNRWMYFSVSSYDLLMFFFAKKSLLELMIEAKIAILVDLDDSLDKKQIILTTVSSLPEDYLPDKDFLFKAEYYTEFCTEFKKRLVQDTFLPHFSEELRRLEVFFGYLEAPDESKSLDEFKKHRDRFMNDARILLQQNP